MLENNTSYQQYARRHGSDLDAFMELGQIVREVAEANARLTLDRITREV
jgi:hypothetical protein